MRSKRCFCVGCFRVGCVASCTLERNRLLHRNQKNTACASTIHGENLIPGASSSAVPRWLCIIPLPHQESLIGQIMICTHLHDDDSVAIILSGKPKLPCLQVTSLAHEPTVGPAHFPGSTTGGAGSQQVTQRQIALETPDLQSTSGPWIFLQCVKSWWHRGQVPQSATMSSESGDTAGVRLLTRMVP